jgi:hypothetical protein
LITPEELSDREEIKALKYAYLRCLDQKNWDELRTLFCDDATAAYSGGRYTYTGADEIVGFVERNMGREQFHSSHRAHHPEIRLDGDVAEVTWALEDIVVDSEWNFLLIGAAFYEDVCRKVDGRWLIQHTGYRRSFETMMPTTSIEGFALTASWWGTDGQSSLPVM